MLLIEYRKKLKTQKLLTLQKEKITLQKQKEAKKNKKIQLMKANIEGQQIERKRIAKELHDGLGGSLSGIKVRLEKIAKEDGNPKVLKDIIKGIDVACSEVRTISHDLIPPNFRNEDFAEIIEKHILTISKQQYWEIDIDIFDPEILNRLPYHVKLEIYRIIQELIHNIQKHANTKRIDFQMLTHQDHISILIEDYGKGFDKESIKNGIGLKNVKERVQILKGNFSIDTMINRGTIINIQIPLEVK